MTDCNTAPKVRGAPFHRAAGNTIAPGHGSFDQPRLGRVDRGVTADKGSGLRPVALGYGNGNVTKCREAKA